MMRLILKIALPVAILLLAAGGFAYLEATRPVAEPEPAEERVWNVAAQPIAYREWQPEVRVYATIVAATSAELRPLVSGMVVDVHRDMVNGAVVEQGEMLVGIDRFEYSAAVDEARAGLAEAKARLAEISGQLSSERELLVVSQEQVSLRRRDLTRRRNLLERGTGTQKAVDDAELALNEVQQTAISRRQTIARLEAQLSQQEAIVARAEVALSRARRDLEDTTLEAPFTGYLTDVGVSVGQRVSEADRLARLIDPERLEARFELANADFARILGASGIKDGADAEGLLGRPAKVVWRVGERKFTFDARIARVGAEIEAATGGVELYARLLDVDPEAPLRPGAFVEVRLPDRRYADVARLPANALGEDGTVYAIEDGRLALHEVTVVRRMEESVLVRSGLPEGAMIVTTRFPEIGPGAKVRVR